MASPYGNAITSEGILQHLLAQLAAQDAADRSRMGGAIGGLIGDYGAVPQGFQDKYGFVTPEIRQMAASNPFSFIAQSERGRKRALGSMKGNRADRGVIQSGGTALQAGDIEYNNGLQNYGALRELTGNIGSMYSDYADSVRGRFDQQAQGYTDAMGRQLEAGFSPVVKPSVTAAAKAAVARRRPKRPKAGVAYRSPRQIGSSAAFTMGQGRPF